MENKLLNIVSKQKQGNSVGIYSACSANVFVIEAVIKKAKQTNSPCLIEATANQVNQFGGYTGMQAIDFKNLVFKIAQKYDFDTNNIYLGGDHLGPLTWTDLDEDKAMENAKELVRSYVLAGFTKIHLDTSMKLNSDDKDARLSDEVIANRGAILCLECEKAFQELLKTNQNAIKPVYIVGSEVPIPGGSTAKVDVGLEVTKVKDFLNTYNAFENTFKKFNLNDAWNRVIAFVVQPGIEEKDAGCTDYVHDKAIELINSLKEKHNIVFEGHSSDYQTKENLRQLVIDQIAILKVGPALTFALREGLYALSFIEDEVCKLTGNNPSNLVEILDQEMLKNDSNWKKHYHGNDVEIAIKRKYSFSDRSRYYYNTPAVSKAIDVLLDNLKDGCPLNLLSQFMPLQYTKVRSNIIENKPKDLLLDKIGYTIDEYLYATKQENLI